MVEKDRLILSISLGKIGLDYKSIMKILNSSSIKCSKYSTITERINELQNYFRQKDYSNESIKRILSDPRVYRTSLDKVINTEKVFKERLYTSSEIEKIEKGHPSIFCQELDSISMKLKFYNDIEIRNIIVDTPKNLIQRLELSYGRYSFLKDNKNLVDKNVMKSLFWKEKRFAEYYGCCNETIFSIYPLPDEYQYKKEKTVIHN